MEKHKGICENCFNPNHLPTLVGRLLKGLDIRDGRKAYRALKNILELFGFQNTDVYREVEQREREGKIIEVIPRDPEMDAPDAMVCVYEAFLYHEFDEKTGKGVGSEAKVLVKGKRENIIESFTKTLDALIAGEDMNGASGEKPPTNPS